MRKGNLIQLKEKYSRPYGSNGPGAYLILTDILNSNFTGTTRYIQVLTKHGIINIPRGQLYMYDIIS